jgi:hypothetical protein
MNCPLVTHGPACSLFRVHHLSGKIHASTTVRDSDTIEKPIKNEEQVHCDLIDTLR